jgi:hypothetical protein
MGINWRVLMIQAYRGRSIKTHAEQTGNEGSFD